MCSMLVGLKDGFNFVGIIFQRKCPSRLMSSCFKKTGMKLWVNSSSAWWIIQVISTRSCRYYLKETNKPFLQFAKIWLLDALSR